MRRLTELMVAALRDHLTSGRAPRVPVAGLYLWQVFIELVKDRGGDPRPMTFDEITTVGRFMGIELQLRHMHLIRALDRAWREQATGAGPLPELTADVFDRLAG